MFIILLAGSLFGAETVKIFKIIFSGIKPAFYRTGSTRITIITILLTIPIFLHWWLDW